MKDPILLLFFKFGRWRVVKEIKRLDNECKSIEKELQRLESIGRDQIKIDYARNKLRSYTTRIEQLKIKYGVNNQ